MGDGSELMYLSVLSDEVSVRVPAEGKDEKRNFPVPVPVRRKPGICASSECTSANEPVVSSVASYAVAVSVSTRCWSKIVTPSSMS